jgi:hypothetical protein
MSAPLVMRETVATHAKVIVGLGRSLELHTDVGQDPSALPGWSEWSEGRAGVIVLERNGWVVSPGCYHKT